MNKFDPKFPFYDDDSDYNTNANSYYKDLGRKTKLIKLLAKRIWEYDERLDNRLQELEIVLNDYLSQWDKRIDELDEEVSHIFVEWLNDGTLEQIINDDVLGNKADKVYVDELNEEVTSQLEHIAISVLAFGAEGDGVHDDRPAIQEGIDYLNSVGGGTLLFPKGYTFLLNSKTYASEGYVIGLKEGVSLDGKGTIKIADNFGDYHSLFFLTEIVNNVSYKNFTIDENTRNNPMINHPDTSGEAKNTRITFFLYKRNSTNVTIENVIMDDCIGVWQITTGRMHNLIIKNNTINYTEFVPNISYDRTSIYTSGINSELSGNTLNGASFANTAIELHGNNIDCFENHVNNYKGFMFITNDKDIVNHVDLFRVYNNTAINCESGISLWFELDGVNVDDVLIYNNFLKVEERALYTYTFSGKNVDVKNVEFYNNTIYTTDIEGNAFQFTPLAINHTERGSYYKQIIIRNNNIYSKSKRLLYLRREGGYPLYTVIDEFSFTDNKVEIAGTHNRNDEIYIRSVDGNFKNVIIKRNEFDIKVEKEFFVSGSLLDPFRNTRFEDNIFTGEIPKRIVPLSNDIQPIIVKQLTNSLTITTRRNELLDLPLLDDTKFYDEVGNKLFKSEGKWHVFKTVDDFKNEYSPIGVVFTSDGRISKITEAGYVPSHSVTTGNHRAGDYVSYGIYTAKVLKDNNYTSTTLEDGDFNHEYFDSLGLTATIVEL